MVSHFLHFLQKPNGHVFAQILISNQLNLFSQSECEKTLISSSFHRSCDSDAFALSFMEEKTLLPHGCLSDMFHCTKVKEKLKMESHVLNF